VIFLIEYDRLRGEIVTMSTHADDQRAQVDEARLRTELRLRREASRREVVVLEAASEEALRRTHARYFKSAQALVPSAGPKDSAA
jgi:predicted dinucleotide-utilizing enzyme